MLARIKGCKSSASDILQKFCSYSSEGSDRHFDYLTDFQYPASWFPAARILTRKIIAHVGPTNSGKSYAALQSLQSSECGLYCGPLRLLAQEVCEQLNFNGTPCDLVTGQEVRRIKGSKHISCTVEMASITNRIQVAVIDEIQMLGDNQRGWNFARTFLGIAAEVVHVCGDPATVQLLQQLCKDCGDEFEVRNYSRLVPLLAEQNHVENFKSVVAGDCVVAFSRQQIYKIKHQIENLSGQRCSVIYGSLPPEARTQQARLFNDGKSVYKVLVASDAIGMGLNLNIRRILFSTMQKYDGKKTKTLNTMEIKQIAGRAGRYGMQREQGFVSCLKEGDMQVLRKNLEVATPSIQQCCLLPPLEKVSEFANHFSGGSVARAIRTIAAQAKLSPHYFMGDVDRMYKIANMLKHLPFRSEDLYTFCCSPCDPEDAKEAATLLDFATSYIYTGQVGIHAIKDPFLKVPKSSTELAELEVSHELFELYVWLSYRFDGGFPDREAARERCQLCTFLIAEGLEYLTQTSVVEKEHLKLSQKNEMFLDPLLDIQN